MKCIRKKHESIFDLCGQVQPQTYWRWETLTQSLGIIVLLNRLRYYTMMLQCYQTMYSKRGTCIQLFTSTIGNRYTYPVIYRYNGKQVHVYPIYRYNSTQVHVQLFTNIMRNSYTYTFITAQWETGTCIYLVTYTIGYSYLQIQTWLLPYIVWVRRLTTGKKGNKSSDKRHILLQQTINSIKVDLNLFHLGFSGSLQD